MYCCPYISVSSRTSHEKHSSHLDVVVDDLEQALPEIGDGLNDLTKGRVIKRLANPTGVHSAHGVVGTALLVTLTHWQLQVAVDSHVIYV